MANFTFSCAQNVCSFDGRSSTDENPSTLTYSWNFGQGSGSGPVPTKTYTSPGTFTVTLTVRDENGLSGVTSQTVTIIEPAGNLPPVPVINRAGRASARTCNFSGVGSADPNLGDTFTYLWNFGDGTATSTSSSPSHTFPADGTYTVTLITTDGWGDAASTTRSRHDRRAGDQRGAEPGDQRAGVHRRGPAPSPGSARRTRTVTRSPTCGTSGDGTATSTASTPSHTFAADGSYTVTLTVTDAWGKFGEHDADRHDHQAGHQRGRRSR